MRKLFIGLALWCSGSLYAQDSLKTVHLEEVAVFATRANEKTPTTYSTVSKEEIVKRNFGQDVPILLNLTPSIVTTSDAGAGVGYTGMRIRGSDATRINVTINGIPINDSESQGMFWVNMPDVSASTNSIQIQRGVGTSSNGGAAFGATINFQTNNVSTEPFLQTDHVIGSFGTRKHNVTLNTGLMNEVYNFEARLSQISSDGYIDRSAADLNSYYLSGGRFGKKTMFKMVIFGGKEITQQAWYGTPEARITGDVEGLNEVVGFSGEYDTQAQIVNLLNADRRFNYYQYDNEVDNYRQDHYQLHFAHTFSPSLNFTGALHYTKGLGFFEQFKADDELADYGLADVVIGTENITKSDIVRRRWLDNDFGGVTYSLNYSEADWNITLGGAANQYSGDHYGEIIWAQYADAVGIRDRYYQGFGDKQDFNVFLKVNYQLTDRLNAFGDGQMRNVNYRAKGNDNDLAEYDIDKQFRFFNPKAGLTYRLTDRADAYASYAIANKEPIRSDFIDAPLDQQPKYETLRNLEVGVRSQNEKWSYQANYYLMDYKDQLVLTGQLNDVGAAVRTNVTKSYRMGIELVSTYRISERFIWSANASLSQNRIPVFSEVVYDYGQNFDEFNVVEIKHEDADISFSPSVVAGSSLSFSPFRQFTAELLIKYVGKQFLDNTSNDDRAIDAYLTNDFRMAYDFSISEIKSMRLSLLINNVFNVEYSSNGYTWGYYYGADLYQQNNYYPQATRNALLGLSIKF